MESCYGKFLIEIERTLALYRAEIIMYSPSVERQIKRKICRENGVMIRL
jgi:hypothetical protein